ncbi:M20 family metallopeptidase [Actinoplanes siamensis]|uniref:Succinyl-diaminopimelate desuccinylase n=1 Tax=Actinoplanes siamensis TaxID=1223317 RepID=A0A919TLX9_9ACTN|nr:M20/M25/M40 family metallo-hydrolase [Actinoplanes siamensis]GIF06939.1 succinyl-diaminopimelate desuccinylase [Actinoplanes siamensis]
MPVATAEATDRQAVVAAAHDDAPSVLSLIRDLVAVPSRGGIDAYGPIVGLLRDWLRARGLHPRVLHANDGTDVAVVCEITGAHPGPRLVLDACLDTAPFGDESAWTYPPATPVEHDGWLYGRGTADSKAAVAIFSHLAARLAARRHLIHGRLVLLFDLDEHTGGFGGAKTYFEGPDAPTDVAGVMIGYPGVDELVVGGRGVHRARLHVHGVSSHSGGRGSTPNAIAKAAQLVQELTAMQPVGADEQYPMGPKVTVTAVEGGQGYSVTPDLCTVNVDIRTTRSFGDRDAYLLLERQTAGVDGDWPDTRPTVIETVTRWPPYALNDDHPLPSALREAATDLGIPVRRKVAGPSNIGNYLAGRDVPATAGFGVNYKGVHATDERIETSTIPLIQAVYHASALTLLGPGSDVIGVGGPTDPDRRPGAVRDDQ